MEILLYMLSILLSYGILYYLFTKKIDIYNLIFNTINNPYIRISLWILLVLVVTYLTVIYRDKTILVRALGTSTTFFIIKLIGRDIACLMK
ncbi:MAG: hypothetical protein ACD_26C00162G0003 [uncultured bacterium]|nr:MAG: hypothetical protein ACD_26C00162G0003 [uncultured bacterium]